MEQLGMDFEAADRSATVALEKPMPKERPPETPESKEATPKILSVSDVNKAIRSTLESNFKLLWIKGEISNFKAHSSGHFYFSLKDSKAMISAIMFRGFNQSMRFKPQDGMEVLVRGKVTVYEPRGNYQIFCELMEPVGAGALQLAFEQLKKKLELEGLFAPEKKRAIPSLPRHVAVVTSPTGAAIRDILNILSRRFAGLRVTVVPAVVQGDAAPASVCAAIALAQRLTDIDVMIVGRGGGSIEDMWAFNDERVARAIAGARVPVISAVGHEIDFTIADFVADLRAPTPSAAAELVVKNAAELSERIEIFEKRLMRALYNRFQLNKQRVAHAAKRLVDPKRRLQDLSLRCDELTQRLEAGMGRYLQRRTQQIQLALSRLPSPRQVILSLGQEVGMLRTRLEAHVLRGLEAKRSDWARLSAVLDSVSPLKVLERGYSITRRGQQVVKSIEQVATGDTLEISFAKGKVAAKIEKVMQE